MKRKRLKSTFKKTLLASAAIFIAVGLFSNALNARSNDSDSVAAKIKKVFSRDYNDGVLLNILTDIQNNINQGDVHLMHNRAEDLEDYIDKRDSRLHNKKHSESQVSYSGARILQIDYGRLFNSKRLILSLNVKSNPLAIDLGKNKSIISSFKDNEINEAKIKYVSFDTKNKKANASLRSLVSNLKKEDIDMIEEDISDIYDNILIDHKDSVSLVSQIRDNLALAKYLINEKQVKAAEKTVENTEILMILLIEAKSDLPAEQQRVRALRKELKNVSRAVDSKYLSEWEKFPAEIKDWWTKNTDD